jgi:hypothetical protein
MRRLPLSLLTALGLGLLPLGGPVGCNDGGPPLSLADDMPDAGCNPDIGPGSFDVFFVVDVSGSMGPFLRELSENMFAFADVLPTQDLEGRRVRVNYRVIAFVNDVQEYPTVGGPMTSLIALQDAFEQAIAAGSTNNNLKSAHINAEPEENLLDALAEVLRIGSTAEARLVMIATDAPFKESPGLLNEGIVVQSSYLQIFEGLKAADMQVHAFTESALDGLTRPWRNRDPELTTLPGSTRHRLADLKGANRLIQDTLGLIARGASCR